MREICPLARTVTPQRELKVKARYRSNTFQTMLVGTTPEYIEVLNASMKEGVFLSEEDLLQARRVCVLGSDAKRNLFYFEEALGRQIKVQDQWYTVVGVLRDKGAAGGKIGGVLEVRNTDEDIYIPLNTILKRFKWNATDPELTQITVKVSDPGRLQEAANIVRAILHRRHRGVDDFKIAIPEELMRQSQRTQAIFNVVMGCIAGISLVVGGIGIMNIMLASVLERTREIGIRRALGARRRDVLAQFLVEAVMVSLIGGLIGVLLGYSMTEVITLYAEMEDDRPALDDRPRLRGRRRRGHRLRLLPRPPGGPAQSHRRPALRVGPLRPAAAARSPTRPGGPARGGRRGAAARSARRR